MGHYVLRALSIYQPFAHLIVHSDEELKRYVSKRIENRKWHTPLRGPLLIHAGKSTRCVDAFTEATIGKTMAFGAIVGIAELIDCVPIGPKERESGIDIYPWMAGYIHAEGPWDWSLLIGDGSRSL